MGEAPDPIDPEEQFDMSVDEFLDLYVKQLEEKFRVVEVNDERDERLTYEVKFGNGEKARKHVTMFVVGGSIFPFDFTPEATNLALKLKGETVADY